MMGNLNTIQQLRDRAGILCAIRWPASYDGKYDSKIKTSVNILRYVLASLAKIESEILKTAVPDDVYVRMGGWHQYYKAVEDGYMLPHPISLD